MISLRNIIPAALLASSAILTPTLAQDASQAAFQLSCDLTESPNPPSTPLDEWINSLLQVLHDNAKFSFEQVVVGFAGTEDGYDVLEAMWESTANGGAGDNWSLLVPSEEVSNMVGSVSTGAVTDFDMLRLRRPLRNPASPPLTRRSTLPPSTRCSLTTPSPNPSLPPSTPRPRTPCSRPCSPSPMETDRSWSPSRTEGTG